MIDLKKVTYSYADHTALSEITMKIEQGESVALIGPNGSGKSTLMKVISGLIYPDRGTYVFDGTKITAKQMKEASFSKSFHKQTGFVFQNPDTQLFCGSVYEEIAFGPNQMGLSENEVRSRVSDALELMGISGFEEREPYHLSGGEKKRVAIAATVALNPDVYLFDEPMNALDPKSKRFLRQFMIDLTQAGKTVICSTHDFSYVDGVFQRAAVFSEDHRLIRDDDYESVINDRAFLREHNII